MEKMETCKALNKLTLHHPQDHESNQEDCQRLQALVTPSCCRGSCDYWWSLKVNQAGGPVLVLSIELEVRAVLQSGPGNTNRRPKLCLATNRDITLVMAQYVVVRPQGAPSCCQKE